MCYKYYFYIQYPSTFRKTVLMVFLQYMGCASIFCLIVLPILLTYRVIHQPSYQIVLHILLPYPGCPSSLSQIVIHISRSPAVHLPFVRLCKILLPYPSCPSTLCQIVLDTATISELSVYSLSDCARYCYHIRAIHLPFVRLCLTLLPYPSCTSTLCQIVLDTVTIS